MAFLFVKVIIKRSALSVSGKLKNLIFEILIIPLTLNINNLRTTSEKSIKLHIIRKLMEYFLNNIAVNTIFTLTALETPLSEGRSALGPTQRLLGSGNVKPSVKNPKHVWLLLKLLEKWLSYKLRRFLMVFIYLFVYLFIYLYSVFDGVFLSYHIRVLDWTYTL